MMILPWLFITSIHAYQTFNNTLPIQTRYVHQGHRTVIDQFEGLMIDQQLQYDTRALNTNNPCTASSQQIEFSYPYKENLLLLVKEFTEEDFKENYVRGKLHYDIPEILAMVSIEKGVAVFTTEGLIHLIKLTKNITTNEISSSILQTKDLTHVLDSKSFQKASMGYNASSQVLYILANNEIITAKLNNLNVQLSDYFIDIQKNNFDDSKKVNAFYVTKRFMYVSLPADGIKIYVAIESKLVQIQIIKCFPKEIRVKVDGQISDVGMQEILFVLGSNSGILIYQVVPSNSNIESNFCLRYNNMPAIGEGNGVTFDVYQNSLMVVVKAGERFQVVDYHLDLQNKTWIELNRWSIQGEVHQIDMNSKFAIVLENGGHYILYHSLNKLFQTQQNQSITYQKSGELYIPSLKQLEFFEDENIGSNLFYGITKYHFFVQEWKEKPIQIECYTENVRKVLQNRGSSLNLNYSLNSTQCPQKTNIYDDMQICHTTVQYEIYFTRSFLRRTHLWVIRLCLGILLAALLIGCICLVRIRYRYLKKKQTLESQIQKFTEEGIIDNLPKVNSELTSQRQYIEAVQSPYEEDIPDFNKRIKVQL